MSTRAIVAVPDEGRLFRGRYVHFDGYPSGAGAEIAAIVHREGWEVAVSVLVEETLGWSTIRSDQQPGPTSVGQVVPGYGIAYTDGRASFLTSADTGCDWAYVVGPEGITVWRCQNAAWTIQSLTFGVSLAADGSSPRAGHGGPYAVRKAPPCPCVCTSGGWCGGCGHAGCGRR